MRGSCEPLVQVDGYAGAVATFWKEFGRYVRTFASNWSSYDAPTSTKVRLMVRNRARSLTRGGCCGNHGEPGC